MWRLIVTTTIIAGICGPVLGAAHVKPRVVTGKDGRPELVLPGSLKAAMLKYNSKMQLRDWDDYPPESLESFLRWVPKRVPWAIWGDFDGNGRTDVALDLRDTKATMSKVVAYHQRRDGGWRPHLLTQYGPERAKDPDYLYLEPRGGEYPHDPISYAVPDSDVGLFFYWKHGRYHVENYGGEMG